MKWVHNNLCFLRFQILELDLQTNHLNADNNSQREYLLSSISKEKSSFPE